MADTSSGLSTTELGEQGSRVVFCHGLFGQGKNWTQVGKALAERHRVTLVDMPDHGRSPWSERFDFLAVADQVASLLSADDPVALVGHSLGGKAAMVVALRHPELVERLCVVDVSPVAYANTGEFRGYMDAMLELEGTPAGSRAEVDEALAPHIPHPTVRAFLMQNLHRDHDRWTWRPNLEMLRRDLGVLGDWPADRLGDVDPYEGSVLWIAGASSSYVTDEYAPEMERLFPKVRRVTIKDAGHWVHSEQPAVFTEVLRRFVD
ncbi:MAG: alpha/beta fold hydrolase [Nocardioides sp.]|nr:alpha/beta fold hydrolase [Nocardioides sp.]